MTRPSISDHALHSKFSSAQRRGLQRRLLAWFDAHGRDMPWRRTRNPYRVLLSEIMLQQTQVDRVLPKWRAFLRAFPTLKSLAAASRRDVIVLWDGLGYNQRAVRLHRLAQRIREQLRGRLPRTVDELRALPGIGPYTAAAIACFAFDVDTPVVDTNIERVLRRLFAPQPTEPDAPLTKGQYLDLAAALLPIGRSRAWNLALMDLGSQVCTPRKPRCGDCPVATWCAARPIISQAVRRYSVTISRKPAERFETSNRYYRGQIIKLLRTLPATSSIALTQLGPRVKADYSADDAAWLRGLVEKMEREGLLDLRLRGRTIQVQMPS